MKRITEKYTTIHLFLDKIAISLRSSCSFLEHIKFVIQTTVGLATKLHANNGQPAYSRKSLFP
jgi:hypothetical protein